MSQWYRRDGENLTLNLYVQPGVKHSRIVSAHGEALKVRLAARPVGGHANAALLEFIAELFDVPSRQVQLKSGWKSRHKVISVQCSNVLPDSIITA